MDMKDAQGGIYFIATLARELEYQLEHNLVVLQPYKNIHRSRTACKEVVQECMETFYNNLTQLATKPAPAFNQLFQEYGRDLLSMNLPEAMEGKEWPGEDVQKSFAGAWEAAEEKLQHCRL